LSTKLANYSPEDVIIVLAGLHTISGYAADSIVRIEKATKTFTASESSDGVVSRTLRASNLYMVTITLAQSSESNEVLSWMHNADKITGGRAKFTILIRDKSGSSVMFSSEAWITGVPSTQFSTSIENRDWEIACAGAANHIGGNYDESSLLEDIVSVGGGLLGSVL
jgi:hypothetical protein